MTINRKWNNLWWASLSARERYLVLGGGIFLGLVLFYIALYAPLNRAVIEKRTTIEDKKNTLALLRQAEPLLKNNVRHQTINTNDYLTALSQQLSHKKFQSFAYQLQQTSDNNIQLSFESVPYALWMDFLWQQMAQYHVTIKQWDVSQTKISGLVQTRVILALMPNQ